MNALIEKNQVETLCGDVKKFNFPDTYHTALFCPECATYVWSEYKSGRFDECWFVRVGTLNEPDLLPPEVHIFTESRQPWVIIPEKEPKFDRFYRVKDVWKASSIARMGENWNPSIHTAAIFKVVVRRSTRLSVLSPSPVPD